MQTKPRGGSTLQPQLCLAAAATCRNWAHLSCCEDTSLLLTDQVSRTLKPPQPGRSAPEIPLGKQDSASPLKPSEHQVSQPQHFCSWRADSEGATKDQCPQVTLTEAHMSNPLEGVLAVVQAKGQAPERSCV